MNWITIFDTLNVYTQLVWVYSDRFSRYYYIRNEQAKNHNHWRIAQNINNVKWWKFKYVSKLLLSSEVLELSVQPVVKPDVLQQLLHLIYSYNVDEVVHPILKWCMNKLLISKTNTKYKHKILNSYFQVFFHFTLSKGLNYQGTLFRFLTTGKVHQGFNNQLLLERSAAAHRCLFRWSQC